MPGRQLGSDPAHDTHIAGLHLFKADFLATGNVVLRTFPEHGNLLGRHLPEITARIGDIHFKACQTENIIAGHEIGVDKDGRYFLLIL